MAIVRRQPRSEWFEYLPYMLIIAIVIFAIGNALWVMNRTFDPTEVHELPTVHVYNILLPEGRLQPAPSGKLR
ncbi:MAG: hypothetical protein H7Y37_01360 [Anaerolineae bacterium]|nr:hypothetical protein [Gloeobacterales cyanobacterium ES-bin-313]